MKKTIWKLDPAHSVIQFKVKHLMISTVTGQFKEFEGTVETEGEPFTNAKVHFSADIHSISTNNDQRDAHLRNGDFFDADAFPRLVFEGDGLEKLDEENYELKGVLTIRGIGRRVKFAAEFGGLIRDPQGNNRVGFELTGKISRKDFGVSFGLDADSSKRLLGEEVKIQASVQLVEQVPELVAMA